MELHGASASPEYLVVTYVSTQFDHNNAADMDALDEIAEMATRAAGLSAYWIASSCMVEADQQVNDVRFFSLVPQLLLLAPAKAHRVLTVLAGLSNQRCHSRSPLDR